MPKKKSAGPLRAFWRDDKGYPHRADNSKLMSERATKGLRQIERPPSPPPRKRRGAAPSEPELGPVEPTVIEPVEPAAVEPAEPAAEPEVLTAPEPMGLDEPPPREPTGVASLVDPDELRRLVAPVPPDDEDDEDDEDEDDDAPAQRPTDPAPRGDDPELLPEPSVVRDDAAAELARIDAAAAGLEGLDGGGGGGGQHHPQCPNADDELVTCPCCGEQFGIVSDEFAELVASLWGDVIDFGARAVLKKQTGRTVPGRELSDKQLSKLAETTKRFLGKVAGKQIQKVEAFAGIGIVTVAIGASHYRDGIREVRAQLAAENENAEAPPTTATRAPERTKEPVSLFRDAAE